MKIHYDLAWFTQDKLHKDLLIYITAKTEKDWLEEFDDIDELQNELSEIYGEENEFVTVNLKFLDKSFTEVIK